MKSRPVTLFGFALGLLTLPVAAFWPRDHKITGTASAQDGDTIIIRGEYIRLSGIDAPELGQSCVTIAGHSWPCGKIARSEMQRLLAAGPVRCEQSGTDRYERTLAICFVGDMDLGAEMVRSGFAVAYRRYSDRYLADEQMARLTKAGMWSGTFTEPETWRREHNVARR